jgi:imidazolonepropionase-like amidohydrolase
VNVLPMDSPRVLAGQTVLISGDRILRIGAARDVGVPSGARTIDGTGKYLILGLVDTHVHLHGNPENEQRVLLKLFLAHGVTTILNMRGNPQILALRPRVASGEVLGPRLYTVGPYVNEPFVTTPDQVDSAVVAERAAGYDPLENIANSRIRV